MSNEAYYRVERDPETDEPRAIYTVKRLTTDEMREYVQGLLSGKYYPSTHVDPQVMGMVFMPALLGALHPSKELYKKFLGHEEAPEVVEGDPPKPKHPGYPEEREPPVKPVLAKPARQVVSDHEWDDIEDDEYQAYLDKIKEDNRLKIREWEDASMAWHQHLDEQSDQRKQIDDAYAEELYYWHNELERHHERTAQREALAQEWEEKRERIFSRWGEEIGTLVGDMGKTFPRSINGYPIFQEFTVVHPADWKRIHAAALRESERLKNLEV